MSVSIAFFSDLTLLVESSDLLYCLPNDHDVYEIFGTRLLCLSTVQCPCVVACIATMWVVS